MAVKRLVRETYFMSPKYTYSHGKEDRIDDKSDDFGEWTKQNTHQHVFTNLEAAALQSGRSLMGRNGVFCDIMYLAYYHPGILEIAFGTHGSYHILVKILSSPSSRELPAELVDPLREKNYEEKPGDFMLNMRDHCRKLPIRTIFEYCSSDS